MSYSDAYKEAMTNAESDEVGFDTIELRHPRFVDDNNQPMGLRFVIGQDDIQARIEQSSLLNPGEVVTFHEIDCEVTQPSVEEGAAPSIQLKLQNTSRDIATAIENASQSFDPIVVIYRPYLLTNLLEGPEIEPPYEFELADVSMDNFIVSGTAVLGDVSNFPFPNKTYKPSVFPGLKR